MTPSELTQHLKENKAPLLLGDPRWTDVFDKAETEDKQCIADVWLRCLNNAVRNNPYQLVPEYLDEHCLFIQKIYPYINPDITNEYLFKGTGYSSKRHYETNVSFDMKERLFQLVDQLWHGSNDQKKAAIVKLAAYAENDCNYEGSVPNWGSMVAILAWEAVDNLHLEGEYLEATIRLSQDVGLNSTYNEDTRDPRHRAWMFITHNIYETNKFSEKSKLLTSEELDAIRQTVTPVIASMPLAESAESFRKILAWSQTAIYRVPMNHPIQETSVLRILFPEDLTLKHVLTRWLPKAKPAWDFAEAMGLNFHEAVDYAIENQCVEVVPLALPVNLDL